MQTRILGKLSTGNHLVQQQNISVLSIFLIQVFYSKCDKMNRKVSKLSNFFAFLVHWLLLSLKIMS